MSKRPTPSKLARRQPGGARRRAVVERKTKETAIKIALDLDGTGKADVDTGIGFFDHMLEQIAKHGGFSLQLNCAGDLEVDEHHTEIGRAHV